MKRCRRSRVPIPLVWSFGSKWAFLSAHFHEISRMAVKNIVVSIGVVDAQLIGTDSDEGSYGKSSCQN